MYAYTGNRINCLKTFLLVPHKSQPKFLKKVFKMTNWKNIIRKEEEEYSEMNELRDFIFSLEDYISVIKKVKSDKELISVIKDLKEEVDGWAFNMERDAKRPPKSDFPDSEARPEFAREHREERL